MEYKKGLDAAKDADFAAALPFGHVRVGRTHIYWKHFLKWSALPYADIERVWRRIEETKSRVGCCSNDFSVHYLMVRTKGGAVEPIRIGEGLYRHEPEALMEALRQARPGMAFGKPTEP